MKLERGTSLELAIFSWHKKPAILSGPTAMVLGAVSNQATQQLLIEQ